MGLLFKDIKEVKLLNMEQLLDLVYMREDFLLVELMQSHLHIINPHSIIVVLNMDLQFTLIGGCSLQSTMFTNLQSTNQIQMGQLVQILAIVLFSLVMETPLFIALPIL